MQIIGQYSGYVLYCPPGLALAIGLLLLIRSQSLRSPGPLLKQLSALPFLFALLVDALFISKSLFVPTLPTSSWGLLPLIDPVSLTMLTLVTFIGWIVIRFAWTQLRGEPGQSRFLGWLFLTFAAVCLLVTAGGLTQLVGAWVLASACLHRLLLFYPDRAAARRAAAKKFIVARAADTALVAGCLGLYFAYGSTDIAVILQDARTGAGGPLASAAAGCLALAAILKSAQFPFHGWLTESIDTPTPVSAFLHAGLINAGGFLLIRFADVLLLTPGVLATLAMVGGFTALFGGLVMLTQPAVKTSLAWSTVGQMGFMIFQCGLGLFAIALLHIVAHSLYKAHAFLSAGQAVETIAANRRPGPVAIPHGRAVLLAFLVALSIYAALGLAFGFAHKSPQAIALGAILVLGVAYMLAQGFADRAPAELTRRTAAYAVAATIAYFALQATATTMTTSVLPPPPPAQALEWGLIALALMSFGFVAVTQATFPLWSDHPAAAGLRVHLMNGLYINALTDRATGGWRTPTPNSAKEA